MAALRFRFPALARLRRLLRDRRGVGAIEFAIVIPLLIMAYIGAFEISVAMTVYQKVNRASATVSDLLTRTQTTTPSGLDSMKAVTAAILQPFPQREGYSLKITGIIVDVDGRATVAWSRDQNAGTPYRKGSTVTLPEDMDAKDTFIVRTEYGVPHSVLLMMPGLSSSLNTLTLGKTSHFRQRVGDKVECAACT
ncbi:pilus assembly protein [Shinella daejeonensis]|uniref:TadE/TadG family type IV pilus assembly protein n=1 Tax=Shinella daejeonensis TaxID=659017 RepID=UPI0020C811D7|nr:TadE/TadG family type IV pilus assembly protein [Shinella daejeonensis]MCP8896704.1 pilus assembly protein [Shinella daejeonensis]